MFDATTSSINLIIGRCAVGREGGRGATRRRSGTGCLAFKQRHDPRPGEEYDSRLLDDVAHGAAPMDEVLPGNILLHRRDDLRAFAAGLLALALP